ISCHESPRPQGGTGSQITELRAGHFDGTNFFDHPGGSLINDRANDRSIQEHILTGNEVQTLRLTLSIAGDAFVEAVDSKPLPAIANGQPAAQRGTLIQVPVREAGGPSARDGSAGRTRTPASCRSPPTPTSTRWASPTGCSAPRTRPTA